MLHFSYGAGAAFLLLRDQVDGQSQGAVVPLFGEFLAGAHRGRFNPKDGQLYVTGMGGWGTYTVADGSFQRVRYTGDPVQLPVAIHARENGILLTFSQPVERGVAERTSSQFAQAWNYRYGGFYGSPEYSARHPNTPGHDVLDVRSAHVLGDGRSVFLEIPDLQPVNQLHLHLQVGAGLPVDMFATVHKLGSPFTEFPGYRPAPKTIAAHPLLADLARARTAEPNPWRKKIPGARSITIEAAVNLTFTPSTITVAAGEPIHLTVVNPDVVPHNWALVRPGTLPRVGDLANKLIADPEAVVRHYVPRTEDVLFYTDLVDPHDRATIDFVAPSEKGRYPFLCTFPGHWMVMNGVMIVR
jgi:azurin